MAGGAYGYGTVFKLDSTGVETVLHDFTGGTDGSEPNIGLIKDKNGNLYGMTNFGGNLSCTEEGSGCGVVYKITP